jgi:excisionase family DNA binding protein
MKQSKDFFFIQPGRLITTDQTAERFNVHRATVTRWVKSGHIKPSYRTNKGLFLFDRIYVDDLIKKNKVSSDA